MLPQLLCMQGTVPFTSFHHHAERTHTHILTLNHRDITPAPKCSETPSQICHWQQLQRA